VGSGVGSFDGGPWLGFSVGVGVGSTVGVGVGGAVGHAWGTISDPLGWGSSIDGTTPLSSGVGCGMQLNDGTGVWQAPAPSSGPQLCPYGMYNPL